MCRATKNQARIVSVTGLVKQIRKLEAYELWKRAVFIRDRFTCQICGRRNGRKRIIEAHHLTSLALLVRQHEIMSVEQALDTSALWEASLGQTLCHDCHEKTDSYPKSLVKPVRKKRKK